MFERCGFGCVRGIGVDACFWGIFFGYSNDGCVLVDTEKKSYDAENTSRQGGRTDTPAYAAFGVL